METLKDAIYDVVHRSAPPAKAIAEELGCSYQYITNAANPNLEEVKFPARFIPAITRMTDNFAILDFMEKSVGRVAFVLPKVNGGNKEITAKTIQAVKEFGDVATEVGKSLANDNKVDCGEYSRIEKEGLEAIRAIYALMMACKEAK